MPSLKRAALLALALAAAAPAHAADAVLEKISGKVQVRARGEKRYEPAASGAPLLFGDEVRVLDGSSAHVVFPSGAAILLKANSNLTMEGGPSRILASIDIGEFLIGIKKKLRRGESFKVRTPAAVAAVRGTLFWGLSDERRDTTYACLSDALTVTAQGRKLRLKAGETVKIAYGQPPADPGPSTIPPGTLDSFAIDGSVEGFKDLWPEAP